MEAAMAHSIQLEPAVTGTALWDDVAVRLHSMDEVAIVKLPLAPGLRITDVASITVRQMVPQGHKLALQDVAEGEPVHRYGQVIGFATRAIRAGEHVHSHNLA